MDAANAVVGDNNPPISEQLTTSNDDLIKRQEELLEACKRMPEVVDSAGLDSDFTDMKNLLAKAIKASETRRVDAKAPHLDAGRVIDGFFKGIAGELDAAKEKILKAQTTYKKKLQKAEQERRAEEDRIAREEAKRLEEEANALAAAAENDNDLEDAVAAEDAASEARVVAASAAALTQASTTDVTRSRGGYGGTSNLQSFWTYEVLNPGQIDLEKLRPFLNTDAVEKAIKAFIRADGRDLRGVRIFEDHRAI